jgi:hypothetical protein
MSNKASYAGMQLFTRIPGNHNSHLLESLESGILRDKRRRNLNSNSNCWICEGWSQVRFEYTPGDEIPDEDKGENKPTSIHLSFLNYKPETMLPDPNEPGIYFLSAMVPPGNLNYFFSIGDKFAASEEQQT